MKKKHHSPGRGRVFVSALLICCLSVITVTASPSISDLYGNKKETTIWADGTDGTRSAEFLSGESIYTNEAVSNQYMAQTADGSLAPTAISDTIDLAAGSLTETGENGHPIPDRITSVEEIVASYCEAADVEVPSDPTVDLGHLDQLTYWQDFKYEATDYRVITGVRVRLDGRTTVLENRTLRAEIDGGEVLRAADIDDYIIIQIDAESGELHYLRMTGYDAETGRFIADFPCIGPYMITMEMDR